ncbi:hypothetical protein BN1047_00002 [Mycolicibacterium neoaurum]|uniref:Uncharacterized protein n=1 Tax=Mycolicibacterium neoaurum TaxID=1795 RepID=A0AAV2WD08_MYCNE|nr:hypothetical protein BN1047_00002 [Mycolicibacterium neoaurum]
MTREATSDGFRMEALASAGTLYLLSQCSTTFIRSPWGSMESMAPTLTPMMSTLSPG